MKSRPVKIKYILLLWKHIWFVKLLKMLFCCIWNWCMYCVCLACRWAATSTVLEVRTGFTVKTADILFRQCRRIRTVSWGSMVKESELRDQQAPGNVCREQIHQRFSFTASKTSICSCLYCTIFSWFSLHLLPFQSAICLHVYPSGWSVHSCVTAPVLLHRTMCLISDVQFSVLNNSWSKYNKCRTPLVPVTDPSACVLSGEP